VSESILRYFPLLSDIQKDKLSKLKEIYDVWNSKINVISRKDMDNFSVHHVLHSLSIAKVINFLPGTTILDVGTGGGFPGIPLAIIFPDCEFTLLDSIEKKIKVVREVSQHLGLKNVRPVRSRIEEEKDKFQFIISRAVTALPEFVSLTSKNILLTGGNNTIGNGILYLKGGDVASELAQFRNKARVWHIKDFFAESYFETKVIVYLPV
jgi:16S rRNA (guanine527-N7)-methyltransferase